MLRLVDCELGDVVEIYMLNGSISERETDTTILATVIGRYYSAGRHYPYTYINLGWRRGEPRPNTGCDYTNNPDGIMTNMYSPTGLPYETYDSLPQLELRNFVTSAWRSPSMPILLRDRCEVIAGACCDYKFIKPVDIQNGDTVCIEDKGKLTVIIVDDVEESERGNSPSLLLMGRIYKQVGQLKIVGVHISLDQDVILINRNG